MPALARITLGFLAETVPGAVQTRLAPAAVAVRISVPRLPGSWMPQAKRMRHPWEGRTFERDRMGMRTRAREPWGVWTPEIYSKRLSGTLQARMARELHAWSSFRSLGESPKFSDDSKEYPFSLHTFRTMSLTGSRNANQPWLQAMAGPHLSVRWETWVELNPHTARKLDIADGDWVWVESPAAKMKVIARLYKGAMPDVVSIPFGDGHRSGGRWATNLGENPYRLLKDDLDPITGYPIKGTTRVKVYKV